MNIRSVSTWGRTQNNATGVYDILKPLCLFKWQKELDQAILREVAPKPGDKILDLGCGAGLLCEKIGRQLDPEQGGMVIGIDAAGKMISIAQGKHGSPVCNFLSMDAESLTFGDATCDTVVASMFNHNVFLGFKRQSLAEAYRVLKPGGRLVIAAIDKPTTLFGAIVSHALRWLLLQPQMGENIRGVMPDLIIAAGFEPPWLKAHYCGYISLFSTNKPL